MAAATSQDLANVATALIDQAIGLLVHVVKDDDALVFQSRHLPGAAIGKHLRHVVDHYRLMLDGAPHGVIDYDSRIHGVNPVAVMETSHAAAISQLRHLRSRIAREAPRIRAEAPIELRATTPSRISVASSFGRELWFASHHAIHHFSLIRIIAAAELHLTIADDFGYAPSTILKNKSQPDAWPVGGALQAKL